MVWPFSAAPAAPTRPSAASDNIFGLSVNCATVTNGKSRFNQFTTGIPNPTFCVATILQLERVGAKIIPDPVQGNPLHCLVSGNSKNAATKLTRSPQTQWA